MKKELNKKPAKTDKEEFAEYIKQLESPNYQGGSWSLPENATPLEKSKYEVCREILVYQRKNKTSDEKLAQQMELTLPETEDILYYRITHFTLDRLLTYANKLFKSEPLMLGYMEKNSNIKQTFSITLPVPLYEKLQKEAGKGKTSEFIKNLLERELPKTDEISLKRAYQELEKCSAYQEEAEEWENSNLDG